MINRAALTPLVVAILTGSLISAAVLQHHENQAAAMLAASTSAGQHVIAEPPPIPSPPTTNLAPVPIPAPAAPPAPALPIPKPPKPLQAKNAPCVVTVKACVKLSSRQAWLLDGGTVILGPVPITSGKKGAATSTGMWTVLWKDRHHKSKEFDDAPMPYSVFFEPGGIAFHTGSLRAQSSGCIHLANAAASRFFSHLSVGDGVQVVR
ncbi:MAG: L,D-transpeptidase [Pseudonocardia sp.]